MKFHSTLGSRLGQPAHQSPSKCWFGLSKGQTCSAATNQLHITVLWLYGLGLKAGLEKAEATKHNKYDALCLAGVLDFLPVAPDTFGVYGKGGEHFMAQLFSRYAKRFSGDSESSLPGQPQRECWQRVAVALRRAVARQLSSAHSQAGGPGRLPSPARSRHLRQPCPANRAPAVPVYKPVKACE